MKHLKFFVFVLFIFISASVVFAADGENVSSVEGSNDDLNVGRDYFMNYTGISNSSEHVDKGVYSFYRLNVSNSTIVGSGVDSTFFNASNRDQSQGIYTYDNVTFCNLTIFGSNYGVFRNYGNLTLNNVRFVNHTGNYYFSDGCIHNSGNLSVLNCEFNNISYYRNSVICDDNSDTHSVVVNNCIFTNIDADYRNAIGYIKCANFSLTNSSIINCGSDKLLSLFCVESCIMNFDCNNVYNNIVNRSLFYTYKSDLSFRNSNFTQNRASGYAASISVSNSTCNITNMTFTGNYAYNSGSCLYSLNSNVTINNSVFDSNTAHLGSCIAVMNGTCDSDSRTTIPSKTTILHSTFKNNNATGYATIYDEFSDIAIRYSNFTNNTAGNYAGVLYVDLANIDIINSNFIQNKAKTAGCIYGYNCRITQQNNIYKNNNATEAIDLYIPYNRKFTDQNTTYTGNNSIIKQLIIPMSTDNNYYEESKINITSYPSYFNLADLGYITPVREQKTGGNCWAFASLAALESCFKMATNKTLDLSENNMKNVMALYSRYGWDRMANDGGYDNMAMAYLLNWYGPILEEDDIYNHEDMISGVLQNIIQINNLYAVPVRENFTDNDKIKEAITKYGAVLTNIYTSYSYSGYNLFNNQTNRVSHAVVIVGWDDNYSRENFGQTPEGDGAFIIKNSWGANAGNNGYYYVSYYDTTILNSIDDMQNTGGYTYILDNYRYDKIYQHDHSGLSQWYMVNDTRYACEYNITGNETVKAFGTYIYDMTAQTNYTAKIYVNGKLNYTQNGRFKEQYIYQTIQLEKPLSLKSGDKIKVELQLTSNKPVRIPIETDAYGRFIPTTQSTIKEYTYSNAVAILKIYTQNTNKTNNTQIIIKQNTSDTIKVIILDQNANKQNTGTLTIENINNQTIDTITVVDEITKINPARYNTRQITIKYQNNNLNPSKITINTTIILKLDITPIKTTQNTQIGENTTLNYTFVDINGNPINGKTKVAIKINGKTTQNLNITNGVLYTTIKTNTQTSKNYNITIILGENSKYNKQESTITLTITKKIIQPTGDIKTSKIGQKITLNYNYLDINGKQLLGINKVAIKINGKTQKTLNITNGVLNTQLDTSTLNTGEHKITIIIGENTNYTKIENTIILTQQKQKIKQITKQITTNYAQNTKLNYTLTDIYGNQLIGTNKVAIKINGKTQQTLTIKNGKLETTIDTSKLNTKEYMMTIVIGESTNYEKSESNITLKINKQTIKTNNTSITIQKGKNTTINMEFKDVNGKKITGINKVAIKINNITYKNLNITNGILKTTIPTDKLKTGKHNMTIIIGENTNYKKSENNITLTIKD